MSTREYETVTEIDPTPYEFLHKYAEMECGQAVGLIISGTIAPAEPDVGYPDPTVEDLTIIEEVTGDVLDNELFPDSVLAGFADEIIEYALDL